MELTHRQQIGLKLAIQKYKNHDKYMVISGYAGTGKAQPVDTIIPTPEGNKKLGDIKIDDYVFDRQGKPTKVLGIFPQGTIDNYKITLEDGRTTYCNGEHLWTYYTSKNNLNNKTTLEMLKAGLKHNGRGTYKFKIPNISNPVEFNFSKQLSIDPYVIGCFLGDGCCKERQLTLSSADEELVQEVSKLIHAKGYVKKSEKNYNWTFLLPEEKIIHNNIKNTKFLTNNFFKEYYLELCCGAEDKRIPFDYKYASIEDRYSLLQGLMDTDGTINKNDNHRYNIRYTSINLKLIKDIQDILYSLGYNSTITIDNRANKYKNNICYELSINIPNEEKYKLFRLTRKKEIALEAKKYPKRKDYSKIAIINIEKLEEQKEMVCIYVDNKEHLYLTNDYIVTHNTTLVKFIVDALQLNPDRVAYCAFTGKAAEVLRKKGNTNSMTLHRLLFESIPMPNGGFLRRKKLALNYDLIVVDEVSMVPKSMIDTLLEYKPFVLFLGDPFQLPQIDKSDVHTLLDCPDVFLDEIMRQEAESEIIQLTMKIRNQEPINYFKGKEVQVLPKEELNIGMLNWADVVLCATNNTRHNLNKQIRKSRGFEGDIQNGEKIIFKRNYWDDINLMGDPIVNGMLGTINNSFESFIRLPQVVKNNRREIPILLCDFIPEWGETFNNLPLDIDFLYKEEPCVSWKVSYQMGKMRKSDLLPRQATWGYAITTHAAQGSEWEKVTVVEESFPYSKIEHARWVYTAATRSSDKLVLVR